jgi:CheY-like chemotaxis protein
MVGFEALSTDDPGSVIARLRADPSISVVVTDLRMPGMDGLELARAIATDLDANHPTEVILISGHATLEVAFDAGRNPIFGFLAKPLRPRMLADMIRAAIEAAHRRQPRPSLNHAGRAPVVTDDTPDNQPYPILRGAFAKVVHRVPLWRRQSTINLDTNRRVAGDPAALADVLSECLVRVACDAEPGSIIAVTVMDNESGIRFRVENPDTPGSTLDAQNIATLDAAIDATALRAGVRVTRGTTSLGGRLIEVDVDAIQPGS